MASPDDVKDYDSTIALLNKLDHEGYDEFGNRDGELRPTILFLDEIHRMPIKGQEDLGRAMEEFRIESKRAGKYIWLPFFTVVGATTDDGKLSKPFRDRFKLRFVFQPYSFEESVEIVRMHAEKMGLVLTAKAVRDIARRGRGVPRIMVGYVERIRDTVISEDIMVASSKTTNRVFEDLGVDKEGLTFVELKIMRILFEEGKPIGLDNLAIMVNEAPKTLSQSAEPFLIQKGFLVRSGKGRRLTEKGLRYMEGSHGNGKFVKKEIEEGYVRK